MRCKLCEKTAKRKGLCHFHYVESLSKKEREEYRRKNRERRNRWKNKMTAEEWKAYKKKHKEQERERRKTDAYKEYHKEYYSRPEVKEKQKKYRKKYYSRPEVRKKINEWNKKYYAEHPEKYREKLNKINEWQKEWWKLKDEDFPRVFMGTLFVSSGDIDSRNARMVARKKLRRKMLCLYQIKGLVGGYKLQVIDFKKGEEKWYEMEKFPKFMETEPRKKNVGLALMVNAKKRRKRK